MDKHCKNCPKHHNAGHPSNQKENLKFNDWCCRYGKPAPKAIGKCKEDKKNGRY